MVKTAILVDGSFFIKRYKKLYKKDNRNPEKVANVLHTKLSHPATIHLSNKG